MNTKIWVLTCVNEEGAIVGLRAFNDLESAQITMKEEYEYERENALQSGYEETDFSDDMIDKCGAVLSYGDETKYSWEIHAAEIH